MALGADGGIRLLLRLSVLIHTVVVYTRSAGGGETEAQLDTTTSLSVEAAEGKVETFPALTDAFSRIYSSGSRAGSGKSSADVLCGLELSQVASWTGIVKKC